MSSLDSRRTRVRRKGAKAVTIFLVLNGMAVAFMLYVLVNFWKEGRQTTHGEDRSNRRQSLHGSKPEVFVATRPLGLGAGRPSKHSVIRFPIPKGRPQENQVVGGSAQGG